MAPLQKAFLLTTCLFLFSWGSALAQGLPPATLFGTGQQICNYQYAIPNGGNCVTYGPALEQKLSAVQQDVDRIKLQYVSTNSVLREELRKLRQQASTTDANVADLTKELKNLQGAVASLQTAVAKGNNGNGGGLSSGSSSNVGSSTTNAMLQQLVTTTKTQLTQDLLKLENKINSAVGAVQTQRQLDAIQQSKVDGAFQAQLRQQQQDLTAVFQKMQQLQNRVNTLQLITPKPNQPPTTAAVTTARPTSPTTSTTTTAATTATPRPATTATATAGSTTPNPLLQQLQKDLGQLQQRLAQLENSYTTDIPDLKKNMSHLEDLSKNQTVMLSDVKQETEFVHNTEIPQLKANISLNYGALAALSRTVNQGLNPLQQQVQNIASSVASLKNQTTRLGTDALTQRVQLTSRLNLDEQQLQDQALEIKLLVTKLNNLQRYSGITTPTPLPTSPTPSTTFAVPTPRPRPGGAQTTASVAIPTPRPPSSG